MKEKRKWKNEVTNIIHASKKTITPGNFCSTPIYMPVAAELGTMKESQILFEKALSGEPADIYSRLSNPNTREIEEQIAVLEGAEDAIFLPSGMAAIFLATTALSEPGDEIVYRGPVYGGTYIFFEKVLPAYGRGANFLKKYSLSGAPKIFFAETLANPTLDMLQMEIFSRLTKKFGTIFICDNTFTPQIVQPLKWGIDIVVHSTTKFISGHGDCMGGAIAGKKHFIDKIRAFVGSCGLCPSPFNSWLTSRGIQSLEARMKLVSEKTLKVASFLNCHPKIKKVVYPGLENYSEKESVKRYFRDNLFGGMIAFEVYSHNLVGKLIENCELCEHAVSLGSTKTKIEHPFSETHSEHPNISKTLIRLSVGVEHHQDIIDDLGKALDKTY